MATPKPLRLRARGRRQPVTHASQTSSSSKGRRLLHYLLTVCRLPWSLLAAYPPTVLINIAARIEHGDRLSGALVLHELLLERILPALLARPIVLVAVVCGVAGLLVLLHRVSGRLDPPLPPPFDDLPARYNPIGRDEDLDWLTAHLQRHTPRIALWGVAGNEYTALAHTAASSARERNIFPDGIVTLDCSHAVSAAWILARVIARFNPSGRPFTGDDLEYARNVCQRRLKGKTALIILRNVSASVALADVVEPLTEAGLTVLLTLGKCPPPHIIPEDCAREMPSLRRPDALRLFERVYAEHSSLPLTGRQRSFAMDIVALLGFHPRRIYETALAAAREHRDLRRVCDELLLLQADSSADAPETALDASASSPNDSMTVLSLPRRTREVAIVLAAFAMGEAGRQAFLAAARDITDSPGDTLKLLIEHGVVHAHTELALPESADRERLIVHSALQPALCQAFLDRSRTKMRQQAYLALAHYYARYAQDQPDHVLERDLDNMLGVLNFAFRYADEPAWSEAITELTVALRRYWLSDCPVTLAVSYLYEAASAAKAGQRSRAAGETQLDTAAEIFLLAAVVLERAGEWEKAVDASRQGIDLCSRDGNAAQVAHLFLQQARAGYGLVQTSLDAEARDEARRDAQVAVTAALKVTPQGHDAAFVAEILSLRVLLCIERGALAEADTACTEAWSWMRTIAEESAGAWRTRGEVLYACSQLRLAQHNWADALDFADDAVEAFREARDDLRLAQAYCLYGMIATLRGLAADARATLESARQLASDIGSQHVAAQAAGMLALIALERRFSRPGGDHPIQSLSVLTIYGEAAPAVRAGLSAQIEGRLDAAEQCYLRALEPLVATRDRRGQGLVTYNLSLVKEAQRFYETANGLRGTSRNLLDNGKASA